MRPPATEIELSVVIPAYNEAQRISEPLRRVDRYLGEQGLASEIVVVDDGSADRTAEVVRALAPALSVPVTVVASTPNRGKGYAVKVGMLRAAGRIILMTDADLSTPVEELARLRACLSEDVQVVIGSRKMAGAVIEERQPFLREMMGRAFTLLTQLVVVQVSDVTCGFKLFTRDAARQIFSRVTLDDWSFDAEALYLARRLGYTVREVPVHWRDASGTKVRRGRDAVLAALGLARIVWNGARGRYALRHRALATWPSGAAVPPVSGGPADGSECPD